MRRAAPPNMLVSPHFASDEFWKRGMLTATRRSKLQGCVGVVQERHERSVCAGPLLGAKLGNPLAQQQRHAPPQRPRLARRIAELLRVPK